MVKVNWLGGMVFEAHPPLGVTFTMDAHPDSGGQGKGPTPLEAMLSSLAACSAMDVVIVLEKKRQKITSYRVEVEGVRGPEGEYPRPFLSLKIRHVIQGENLDEAAVARAVQLSDEKYCTVISTLRAAPEVKSEYVIEG